MAMTDTDRDHPSDAELELFFAAARAEPPEMSGRLFAAMMQDAAQVQAQIMAPVAAPAAPLSFWRRALQTLGGWGVAGGLATAGIAGLSIGVLAGPQLETLSNGLLGSAVYAQTSETYDLIPDYTSFVLDASGAEG